MLSIIKQWIQNFDFVSFILGTVVSSVFGIWLAYRVKMPKLVSNSSGGGRGPKNTWSNSIGVTNQDGFLGIIIGPTILFGKPIHRPIRLGQTFPRAIARDCMARLYEKDTNKAVGQLLWQTYDEANQVKFQGTINIESGKTVTLKVFTRTEAEPLKYFKFHPENLNSDIPKIPEEVVKFDGKIDREFIIEISSKDSPKPIKINCRVFKDLTVGSLYIESRGKKGRGTSKF